MANVFKVQLLLDWLGYGWREDYYCAPPDDLASTAVNQANGLQRVRRQLLANTGRVVGYTVVDVANLLRGRTYTGPGNGGKGLLAPIAINPGVDMPEMALYARMYDETRLAKRGIYMRGIWGSYLNTLTRGAKLAGGAMAMGPLTVPFQTFAAALRGRVAIGEEVISTNFVIRVRATPPAGPGQPITPLQRYDVIDVRVSTLGYWEYRINALTPVLPGSRVHFHNVNGCGIRGANGDTVITEITTAPPDDIWVTTTLRACCRGTPVYRQRGDMYIISYYWAPIAEVLPEFATTRSTGKSMFRTRGKTGKPCCGRG